MMENKPSAGESASKARMKAGEAGMEAAKASMEPAKPTSMESAKPTSMEAAKPATMEASSESQGWACQEQRHRTRDERRRDRLQNGSTHVSASEIRAKRHALLEPTPGRARPTRTLRGGALFDHDLMMKRGLAFGSARMRQGGLPTAGFGPQRG
jgi:hypothetical protein